MESSFRTAPKTSYLTSSFEQTCYAINNNKKARLEARCYQELKWFPRNQNLYKPTELGAEFHWNEKLDDCSPVNLLNIDWSVRQSSEKCQ